MLRIRLLIVVGLLLGNVAGFAQNRVPAFEMNARLGRGINMGNTFEAPSETEWGNPWKPEYFRIISELGFSHVRVPIRWEPSARSMESAPYTINAQFLDRIQQVVDTALKYKLHIIINMHHHDALFENPAAQKERFLSQWEQIAGHFKDYPDSLLFEILNEPHGNVTPDLWNEYFADALAGIRITNPTRVVIMGVAEFGGLGGISKLQLPDDEYIILSPHYYNPFAFTHQGAEWVDGADAWLGTEWLDTEAERESAASEFNYAIHFSETQHIPIHVGEFGAYSKADEESRERWTTFLARWFEEKNFSWAYWEFSAGFGIYDPSTEQHNSGLVDALLHNEMPEPTPVLATPVYTSDFSTNSDGWSLSLQGGAAGNLSSSSGNLNVSISNGGTESWHVQLVKNNILLEKDNLYRISFTVSALADRGLTFYAGRASDPWNAYSSQGAISIGASQATYTSTFTMTSPTDAAARLVFDLGREATGVTISHVALEKLTLAPEPEPEPEPITDIAEENVRTKVLAHPNPVSSWLSIENAERYHTAELYDLTGRAIATFEITRGTSSLNLDKIFPGVYLLSLKGNGKIQKIRFVKE